MLGQQVFEVIQVVVAEADLPRAGGLAAMMQAGVRQAVGERHRGPLAGGEQGRQHRGVGLPAGGEQQGGLRPLQGGEPGFYGGVDLEGSAHQPRGSRADAVAAGPFAGPLDQGGMARQAEIVVGGQVDQLAPVDAHPAAVQRLQRPQAAAAILGLRPPEGLFEIGVEPGHYRPAV